MKNFHFEFLRAQVLKQVKNELGAKLTIYGYNPDVYDGKQLKLNLKVTGDLMGLLNKNSKITNFTDRLLTR